MTCNTPEQRVMKLAPAEFHYNFQGFHFLECFCRRSKMPSRFFFLYNFISH
jgi:hypothetical protein